MGSDSPHNSNIGSEMKNILESQKSMAKAQKSLIKMVKDISERVGDLEKAVSSKSCAEEKNKLPSQLFMRMKLIFIKGIMNRCYSFLYQTQRNFNAWILISVQT